VKAKPLLVECILTGGVHPLDGGLISRAPKGPLQFTYWVGGLLVEHLKVQLTYWALK